jgi:hypothetical protein
MAIHIGGTFHYEILVEEEKVGLNTRLTGKGRTTREPSIHPGLLGYTPEFEVSEGLVILRSRESEHIRRTNKHFVSLNPVASAAFDLGEWFPLVIQGGDLVHFHRSGTGDFGFSVTRNDRLILAMGAIVDTFLGSDLEVRDDPRLSEIGVRNDPRSGDPKSFLDYREKTLEDFRLTVVIQNQSYSLQEGEELLANDYYIFFERAHKIGIPGRQSLLTIAQLNEKLTKETVMNCTKRFTAPSGVGGTWELYTEPSRKWWQIWK